MSAICAVFLATKIIIKHKFKSRFVGCENRPLTSGCLLGNRSVKYNRNICPTVINVNNMIDYWAVMEGSILKIKCHSEQYLCFSLDHCLMFLLFYYALVCRSLTKSITYMPQLAGHYLSNLSVTCCNLCSRAVIEIKILFPSTCVRRVEGKVAIRCEHSFWENTPSFHMCCWNPSDPYLTWISL